MKAIKFNAHRPEDCNFLNGWEDVKKDIEIDHKVRVASHNSIVLIRGLKFRW